MRQVLVVGVIALLMAGAWPAGASEAEAERPVLYLKGTPDERDHYNVTTIPPEGEAVALASKAYSHMAMEWNWVIRQPEDWILKEGEVVRATLYFSGLDTLIPLRDPLRDPGSPTRHTVQLDIFAYGVIHWTPGGNGEVRPSRTANVSGEASFQTRFPAGDGRAEVTVETRVPVDVPFRTDKLLQLRIRLTGITPAAETIPGDREVYIRTEGGDAPSRIELPGFPIEAFAAWEAEDAARRACHVLLLRGGSCAEPAPPAVVQESSMGALWIGMLLGALAIAVRRRR